MQFRKQQQLQKQQKPNRSMMLQSSGYVRSSEVWGTQSVCKVGGERWCVFLEQMDSRFSLPILLFCVVCTSLPYKISFKETYYWFFKLWQLPLHIVISSSYRSNLVMTELFFLKSLKIKYYYLMCCLYQAILQEQSCKTTLKCLSRSLGFSSNAFFLTSFKWL